PDTHPATTHLHTLSLHDALPISHLRRSRATAHCSTGTPCPRDRPSPRRAADVPAATRDSCGVSAPSFPDPSGIYFRSAPKRRPRSEEHTSELQSRSDLVCRLLLE